MHWFTARGRLTAPCQETYFYIRFVRDRMHFSLSAAQRDLSRESWTVEVSGVRALSRVNVSVFLSAALRDLSRESRMLHSYLVQYDTDGVRALSCGRARVAWS